MLLQCSIHSNFTLFQILALFHHDCLIKYIPHFVCYAGTIFIFWFTVIILGRIKTHFERSVFNFLDRISCSFSSCFLFLVSFFLFLAEKDHLTVWFYSILFLLSFLHSILALFIHLLKIEDKASINLLDFYLSKITITLTLFII